jgi:hypothetical protein
MGESEQVSVWILVITCRARVRFAPEIYLQHDRAVIEARRWASELLNREPARSPLPGRWVAGEFEVRTVPRLASMNRGEIWIGTLWDEHGRAEEEAVPLASRKGAQNWLDGLPGRKSAGSEFSPWRVSESVADGPSAEINLAKTVVA